MTGTKGKPDRPLDILWSDRARGDLAAIGDYIAADDLSAAIRWVEGLIAGVERAARMPLSGRSVPEYTGRQEIREQLIRTYRIVYRVRDEVIEVLTIFEGHRLFPTEAVSEEDDT